jgi:hypothetical protein
VKFEWKRPLGIQADPYLKRSVAPLLGRSLRLHRWCHDDDHGALHDHPSWFITIVLRGGYTDVSEDKDGVLVLDKLRPGSIRLRPAAHRHHVVDVQPNTWTLCLFGKPKHRWAFYLDNGRRLPRDKYFAEVGHHTPDGERVRLRPDGTEIAA